MRESQSGRTILLAMGRGGRVAYMRTPTRQPSRATPTRLFKD
jgi:hypothetical protein